jgi:hypothetical protein
LLNAFPFRLSLPREGEPPRPTSFDIIRFPDKETRIWMEWIGDQPDIDLLHQELMQTHRWVWKNKAISREEIDQWREERWNAAEKIRKEGHSEILDLYWGDNLELRGPPLSTAPQNPSE